MNELLEKIDNLKKELDKSDLIKSLKEVQDKVYQDKELSSMIEEYSISYDEKLKKKILKSPLFQEYKVKETDLNLFIMDMNQRLKKISKKGSCNHESN